MPLRVTIDSEKCQGHQVCATMMPAFFGSDDLGYGVPLGDALVDPADEADLDLVIGNCPERAIEAQPE